MNAAERGPQAGPLPGGAGPPPLLEVRDLAVTYGSGDPAVRAVRGVGFTLHAGLTGHAHRLPGMQREADAAHGAHGRVAGTVSHREIAHLQQRRRAGSAGPGACLWPSFCSVHRSTPGREVAAIRSSPPSAG